MIVRWRLDALPGVLAEAGGERHVTNSEQPAHVWELRVGDGVEAEQPSGAGRGGQSASGNA